MFFFSSYNFIRFPVNYVKHHLFYISKHFNRIKKCNPLISELRHRAVFNSEQFAENESVKRMKIIIQKVSKSEIKNQEIECFDVAFISFISWLQRANFFEM